MPDCRLLNTLLSLYIFRYLLCRRRSQPGSTPAVFMLRAAGQGCHFPAGVEPQLPRRQIAPWWTVPDPESSSASVTCFYASSGLAVQHKFNGNQFTETMKLAVLCYRLKVEIHQRYLSLPMRLIPGIHSFIGVLIVVHTTVQ